MNHIIFAQVDRRSVWGTPTRDLRLEARGPVRHTAVDKSIGDIDTAETLDRQTVWPTHRIRCFLQVQVQRCQRASGTR